METTYLATVSLPGRTGQSDDVYVTTWHFRGTNGATPRETDADNIGLCLATFWDNDMPVSNTRTALFLSSVVDASRARIRIYQLSDDRPRVPVSDFIANYRGNAAGVGLPSEVAVVLSSRVVPGSGENPARMRGRQYIGPLLNSGAGTSQVVALEAVTNTPIVATAMVNHLQEAAAAMAQQALGLNVPWAIFSPTTAGPLAPVPKPPQPTASWSEEALVAATRLVEEVRVDRAFDTQRRRGEVRLPGAWVPAVV